MGNAGGFSHLYLGYLLSPLLSNVIYLGAFPSFFFFPLFSPSYPKFIGQTGTVHRITDRGDVRVQFNSETRWTFHPGALTKVGAGPGLGMLQGNH